MFLLILDYDINSNVHESKKIIICIVIWNVSFSFFISFKCRESIIRFFVISISRISILLMVLMVEGQQILRKFTNFIRISNKTIIFLKTQPEIYIVLIKNLQSGYLVLMLDFITVRQLKNFSRLVDILLRLQFTNQKNSIKWDKIYTKIKELKLFVKLKKLIIIIG